MILLPQWEADEFLVVAEVQPVVGRQERLVPQPAGGADLPHPGERPDQDQGDRQQQPAHHETPGLEDSSHG